MTRIAVILILLLTAARVHAATISVELEVAGSDWGSLQLDTVTGQFVDSDLKMPYGAGTPESPNGWNNFTPVTGPLGWQIVAPDLALLTLPERNISQLVAVPDPHSPDGFYWLGSSFTPQYRYVTNILFEPSTLIGLDRDLFMSHQFEGWYGNVFQDFPGPTFSQSGSKQWIRDERGFWDDDGNFHGQAQDIWLRVPEPSTWALGILGLASLSMLRLKRRRLG